MSMGSQDNKKSSSVIASFSFAMQGIKTALIAERNMRIHFTGAVIVIICSILLSISRIEWLFILLAIGGVFALELVNTAVERLVDLVTEEYHPYAKQAKDLAAGAVFIYAIMSAVIGSIILLPHLFKWF